MDVLHDTYFWVVVSFLLFAAVAYRFGRRPFLASLDAKIETVRKEIAASEKLKAEAQALLLDYEQRQRDAQAEAEAILQAARDQATKTRVREEARLDEALKRKEQALEDRLNRLRDQAVAEIRQTAATLACDAAQNMITQKMDAETRTRLIDRAIDQMGRELN